MSRSAVSLVICIAVCALFMGQAQAGIKKTDLESTQRAQSRHDDKEAGHHDSGLGASALTVLFVVTGIVGLFLIVGYVSRNAVVVSDHHGWGRKLMGKNPIELADMAENVLTSVFKLYEEYGAGL